MFKTSYARILRYVSIFVLLVVLALLTSATISAMDQGDLQKPLQQAETPEDPTKKSGEQPSPATTPDVYIPPISPESVRPGELIDVTVPRGGAAPYVPPEEIPVGPIVQEPLPGSEGLVDASKQGENGNTRGSNLEVPPRPTKEPPSSLDPALDASKSGSDEFSPESDSAGSADPQLAPTESDNLDDFDRPNGGLGPSWTNQSGTISIVSQRAQSATSTTNLATYNGIGTNKLSGDVSLNPGGGLQYAAFVLNRGAGTNNIFVKVQDNNGDGKFDRGACYTGNNNSGALFGLGFFTLDSPFTSARMHVSVDTSRTVTLDLTNIDGGSGTQSYTCTGAPVAEGYQVGIGSWNGGQIDNLSVDPAYSLHFDGFYRQDGPLGSNWMVRAGSITINNGDAQADSNLSLATFNGISSDSVGGDVAINPAGGIQYAGFVLNYGAGVNNIFVKVQEQDGDGMFEHGACYTGNNNTGGSFGLGFFTLDSPFTSAHMQVSVDANRTVTLHLSNIDGGSGTQSYTCTGAPAPEGDGVGIASLNGGRVKNFRSINDFKDSFSRPDGPLGSNWTVQAGNIVIENQAAKSVSTLALATYDGAGSNWIEGDVTLTAGGGLKYTGFVLNRGAGTNNIFVKVQDNDGDGMFDTGACYTGNNGPSFGLGFFPLSPFFTSAHLRVSVDVNRTVTILLTNIDGGSGVQVYTCTGAPAVEGPSVGIVGLGGGLVDNVVVDRIAASDGFERPNGAPGPNWSVRADNFTLTNGTAQAGSGASLATFNGVTSDSVEGDVVVNPSAGLQYAGFILNYGAGVDNIFVKVQEQDGDGKFDHGACYKGNNNTGAPFGLGFFTLDSPFTSAHMQVSVDANRTVTLLLTNIDGGSGTQIYTCTGAPAPEGDGVGIVGFGNGRVDSIRVRDHPFLEFVYIPLIRR